ncbi:hypothetical protein E2C01_079659 [Portunus trituberculatus]|uniref:Uncharacterized protein n=1 Tax=Portunus trituberculatus TaxID=210409 RepID=A0A5B7ITX4_PORTR|nr:hypothetical protein [Portunus trituberculatus]
MPPFFISLRIHTSYIISNLLYLILFAIYTSLPIFFSCRNTTICTNIRSFFQSFLSHLFLDLYTSTFTQTRSFSIPPLVPSLLPLPRVHSRPPAASIFQSPTSYWTNPSANLYSNIAAASGHTMTHHPSHMTSHISSAYPHYA